LLAETWAGRDGGWQRPWLADSGQSSEEVAHTVVHEMGHELTGPSGHTADGLMLESVPRGSKSTTATLALVCSELPCAWMRPEE
jgi:hypothetical protein